MKKAWLEAQIIRDVAQGNPNELYHPDIASHYDTDVPDDAANGDTWDGTTLTKPVQPEFVQIEVIAVPPKVTPIEFKLLFTVTERINIVEAKSTDPILTDIYSILDDPRLTQVDLALQSTLDTLDYLVSKNLLVATRVPEILTGIIK
jgi:hypothetical protein